MIERHSFIQSRFVSANPQSYGMAKFAFGVAGRLCSSTRSKLNPPKGIGRAGFRV
jgi:hypothetical protein